MVHSKKELGVGDIRRLQRGFIGHKLWDPLSPGRLDPAHFRARQTMASGELDWLLWLVDKREIERRALGSECVGCLWGDTGPFLGVFSSTEELVIDFAYFSLADGLDGGSWGGWGIPF